jgi:hypothetical protein
MNAAREAALLRVACAIWRENDRVSVSAFDPRTGVFQLLPSDALSAGKRFVDHDLYGSDMYNFIGGLVECSPETTVRRGLLDWAPIPEDAEILPVVEALEMLILHVPNWKGDCISPSWRRLLGRGSSVFRTRA